MKQNSSKIFNFAGLSFAFIFKNKTSGMKIVYYY